MPGFCLHLISFQLLIGWQRLWSFLFLFSSFLNSSILRPSWWIFEMYFVWFFLCFWPSFQIIFTFPASAGWVKCEEFWSNEMVDKSMWFFFLLFHPFIHSSFIVLWFFFRLDFKKNCSFKSSFVDFFFVKLQVFVYFSLMRGILMISSYLLMFGITSEPCTGKLHGIFFNVSRVLDFIECLEMIVVDLAWICRIAVACILWCKCRISFLLLFLLNEIGWFL